jgi:hypothetical protein
MATLHNTLNVSDSSTVIVEASGGFGHDVTIQNNGSYNLFLGGSNVDSENFGFKLVPNAAISFELDGQDAIYGYCDNNTFVTVLKINLERTK